MTTYYKRRLPVGFSLHFRPSWALVRNARRHYNQPLHVMTFQYDGSTFTRLMFHDANPDEALRWLYSIGARPLSLIRVNWKL